MIKGIITGASALAIIAAVPALAETKVGAGADVSVKAEAQADNNTEKPDVDQVTDRDIERGWENTKEAVSDTTKDIQKGVENAYEDMRTYLRGTDKDITDVETINIKTAHTAEGIIGSPLNNSKSERVGTVHDIIVDRNGKPIMLVVSDGELLGFVGKKAAFDYDVVMNSDAKGDVVASITEDMIDKAAEFSYEQEASGDVRVIPGNGYSVAEILDGKLLGSDGKTLGDIDNISFHNGQADLLIVAFDQVLGLGGKKAALSYAEANTETNADGKVNLKLSAAQTAQFKSYAEAATN